MMAKVGLVLLVLSSILASTCRGMEFMTHSVTCKTIDSHHCIFDETQAANMLEVMSLNGTTVTFKINQIWKEGMLEALYLEYPTTLGYTKCNSYKYVLAGTCASDKTAQCDENGFATIFVWIRDPMFYVTEIPSIAPEYLCYVERLSCGYEITLDCNTECSPPSRRLIEDAEQTALPDLDSAAASTSTNLRARVQEVTPRKIEWLQK